MRARIVSLALMVAILLQLSGSGLIHALQIHALHKAQMERIAAGKFNHKEQVILNVHPHELNWVKAHEFIYKGYMYDVVSVAEINGEWQIAALKDEREDKVRAQLKTHQQNEPAASGHVSLKITNLVYLLPEYDNTKLISTDYNNILPVQIFLYQSAFKQISSPPPEA